MKTSESILHTICQNIQLVQVCETGNAEEQMARFTNMPCTQINGPERLENSQFGLTLHTPPIALSNELKFHRGEVQCRGKVFKWVLTFIIFMIN